jgi:hypothetical protein
MARKQIFAIASHVALACSLIVGVYMAKRFLVLTARLDEVSRNLIHLEKIVQKREQADPLIPSECSVETGLGELRSRPCHTTFYRLLQAPQKFHGRWIIVDGLYASRFEESALYSPNFSSIEPVIVQRHSAIWVTPQIKNNKSSLTAVNVIGKFENGASGHMNAYFGKLTNAAEVTGD